MTTFVLVHGSFHGGWCWKRLEPNLRAEQHTVYTPTMTGLGDRSHLVHPRAGLELNVRDIERVFECEDLQDVVLVGHSYGCLVITGAAESCYDRIDRMVYLDGFLPEHGQSAFDINQGSENRWTEKASESGAGWLVPPPDPAEAYEISDPDILEWMRERLVPTTLMTHSEPLDAPEERAKELPRSFISCNRYERFQHMAQKAKGEGLDYHEINTGHDAMISAPDALSANLLDLVGSS